MGARYTHYSERSPSAAVKFCEAEKTFTEEFNEDHLGVQHYLPKKNGRLDHQHFQHLWDPERKPKKKLLKRTVRPDQLRKDIGTKRAQISAVPLPKKTRSWIDRYGDSVTKRNSKTKAKERQTSATGNCRKWHARNKKNLGPERWKTKPGRVWLYDDY